MGSAQEAMGPADRTAKVDPDDLAGLELLAGRTEALWGALSGAAGALEADLAKSAPEPAAGAANPSRVLPAGAMLVRGSPLPLTRPHAQGPPAARTPHCRKCLPGTVRVTILCTAGLKHQPSAASLCWLRCRVCPLCVIIAWLGMALIFPNLLDLDK